MRQTCTDHCAGCGHHFHGLGAFEAHRRDLQCLDPATAHSETGRRLLQVWTEDGYCDLVHGAWRDGKRVRYEHPVQIWQRAGVENRLAELASLSRSRQEAGRG